MQLVVPINAYKIHLNRKKKIHIIVKRTGSSDMSAVRADHRWNLWPFWKWANTVTKWNSEDQSLDASSPLCYICNWGGFFKAKQTNLWWCFSLFMLTTCSGPYNGPSSGHKTYIWGYYTGWTRAVTGLPTGHNTLRRHLYLLGLLGIPLCRKCGVREETSVHILCECEALVSLRHAYLRSFFLEPEDIKCLGLGAIWNFSKVTGLPWFGMGHKESVKSRPRCIGAKRPRTQTQINQSINIVWIIK